MFHLPAYAQHNDSFIKSSAFQLTLKEAAASVHIKKEMEKLNHLSVSGSLEGLVC